MEEEEPEVQWWIPIRQKMTSSYSPLTGIDAPETKQACNEGNANELRANTIEWNIPTAAQVGDLVLMYRTAPVSTLCSAWQVTGRERKHYGLRNRERRMPGLQGEFRRVATFDLPYSVMKCDPRIKPHHRAEALSGQD